MYICSIFLSSLIAVPCLAFLEYIPWYIHTLIHSCIDSTSSFLDTYLPLSPSLAHSPSAKEFCTSLDWIIRIYSPCVLERLSCLFHSGLCFSFFLWGGVQSKSSFLPSKGRGKGRSKCNYFIYLYCPTLLLKERSGGKEKGKGERRDEYIKYIVFFSPISMSFERLLAGIRFGLSRIRLIFFLRAVV